MPFAVPFPANDCKFRLDSELQHRNGGNLGDFASRLLRTAFFVMCMKQSRLDLATKLLMLLFRSDFRAHIDFVAGE